MLQLQLFLDRLLHFWILVFTTVSVTIIYLLLFGAGQSVELTMCELLYMLSLYHIQPFIYIVQEKVNAENPNLFLLLLYVLFLFDFGMYLKLAHTLIFSNTVSL